MCSSFKKIDRKLFYAMALWENKDPSYEEIIAFRQGFYAAKNEPGSGSHVPLE